MPESNLPQQQPLCAFEQFESVNTPCLTQINTTAQLSTQAVLKQTQTNVLSRISCNSCWEVQTETQSSMALLAMVHCLPSRQVRGVLIQSAVWKYASGTRSTLSLLASIPLLTHVDVLLIIEREAGSKGWLRKTAMWQRLIHKIFYSNVTKCLDFWFFKYFIHWISQK